MNQRMTFWAASAATKGPFCAAFAVGSELPIGIVAPRQFLALGMKHVMAVLIVPKVPRPIPRPEIEHLHQTASPPRELTI